MLHHHRIYASCLVLVVLILSLFAAVPTTLQAQAGVQVTTTADINLRSGPQTTAKVITILPAGTTLAAIGRNQAATWIQVNSASGPGWVSAAFVKVSASVQSLPVTEGQPAPASGGAPAPAGGVTGTVGPNGLSVRQQPSASSTRLDLLPAGTTVTLTGRFDGSPLWVRFSFQGQDAWLAGWLLAIQGDVTTLPVVGPAAPAPAPAPAGGASGGNQPAAGGAKLIFVNQLATTLHIVVTGPQGIDVNIGPNATLAYDVPAGTYVLNASAQERSGVSDTVTLVAGGSFTWVLHG